MFVQTVKQGIEKRKKYLALQLMAFAKWSSSCISLALNIFLTVFAKLSIMSKLINNFCLILNAKFYRSCCFSQRNQSSHNRYEALRSITSAKLLGQNLYGNYLTQTSATEYGQNERNIDQISVFFFDHIHIFNKIKRIVSPTAEDNCAVPTVSFSHLLINCVPTEIFAQGCCSRLAF